MFYQKWAQAKISNKDCTPFILSFLESSTESIDTFLYGSADEVVDAIKLLLSVSIEDLLDSIKYDNTFASKDVFQYSKLEDAVISLCNILEYEEKSLTFFEAGQRLTQSDKEFACIKYGENHIKTAEAFSLVKLEKPACKGARYATITALGSIFTRLSNEEKYELVRRLALRNKFVKSLIFNAKNREATYQEIVSRVLSGQTIIRRKHNVEIIVKLILKEHPITNNIRW